MFHRHSCWSPWNWIQIENYDTIFNACKICFTFWYTWVVQLISNLRFHTFGYPIFCLMFLLRISFPFMKLDITLYPDTCFEDSVQILLITIFFWSQHLHFYVLTGNLANSYNWKISLLILTLKHYYYNDFIAVRWGRGVVWWNLFFFLFLSVRTFLPWWNLMEINLWRNWEFNFYC